MNCFGVDDRPPLEPVIQADLEQGSKRMTTWLTKHPKLKEGVSISFKGETDKWFVRKIYSIVDSTGCPKR